MKKLKWGAGLALAAGLAVLPVLGQETAKKEPPKPAPSPSQAVLEQWNEIGRKLTIIAEDLPEDKYDYKPNPDSRTFRAVLLNVSASMCYFTDTGRGKRGEVKGGKGGKGVEEGKENPTWLKRGARCRASRPFFFVPDSSCDQSENARIYRALRPELCPN